MSSSRLTPYDIDAALADSFPASDPPAWTPGIARLTPQVAGQAISAIDARDAARSDAAPERYRVRHATQRQR
jgi:hypothetical protein